MTHDAGGQEHLAGLQDSLLAVLAAVNHHRSNAWPCLGTSQSWKPLFRDGKPTSGPFATAAGLGFAVREPHGSLSPESRTRCRPPEASVTVFPARLLDSPCGPLMDKGLVIPCRLARCANSKHKGAAALACGRPPDGASTRNAHHVNVKPPKAPCRIKLSLCWIQAMAGVSLPKNGI